MSEIAKCRCGAEATLNSPCVRGEAPFTHFVDCERCGSSGPNEDSPAEAIADWNTLMRPRPVAEWEWRSGTYAQYLSCEHVDLGYVMWKRGCVPPWVAYCAVTDEESGPMMLEDARAWLEERVRAAGFEVREESSRG